MNRVLRYRSIAAKGFLSVSASEANRVMHRNETVSFVAAAAAARAWICAFLGQFGVFQCSDSILVSAFATTRAIAIRQ
jgi:hypothetical protein